MLSRNALKFLTLKYTRRNGSVIKAEASPVRGVIGAKLYAKKYLDPSKGLNRGGASQILIVEINHLVAHDSTPSKYHVRAYQADERTIPLDEYVRTRRFSDYGEDV